MKNLIEEGDIPYLDVNGRLRFSEPEVREALSILAHKPKRDKAKEIAKCSA
ncbi:hypothetical protein ACFL5Z_09990 [Planctomycetota bacterium]